MIQYYNIHFLLDGAAAIDFDGQGTIVIDTGSPATFMDSGRLQFLNNTITVQSSIQHLNSEYLSTHLLKPVTGLIGMDQLTKTIVLLDYENKRIGFCDKIVDESKLSNAFTLVKNYGLPLLDVYVNGRTYRGVLDTGAHLSYALPDLCNGLTQNGMADDFNPSCGLMTSPKYTDFKYQLGDIHFQHEIHQANSNLQNLMRILGIQLILGYDFFKNRPFVLDFPSLKLFTY